MKYEVLTNTENSQRRFKKIKINNNNARKGVGNQNISLSKDIRMFA